MAAGAVGRDDRCRLAQPVSLVHRDSQGVIELLQVLIQQGAPSDKELQLAPEVLTDFREQ